MSKNHNLMYFSNAEFEALSEATTDSAIGPESDTKVGHESISSCDLKPNIEIFSWTYTRIRTKELRDAGWKRPKGADPIIYAEPSHWVDMETGEIFTKYQVRSHGIEITPSQSLRMIQAQSVIQPLPDEKRYFILYILRLRNTRAGLIVDLETAIDRWIAWVYPNIDITDRSRKRKSLESWLYKYEILANRQTFKTDFQFIAHSNKKDYIAEESRYPARAKHDCEFYSDPLTERKRIIEWVKSKKIAPSNVRISDAINASTMNSGRIGQAVVGGCLTNVTIVQHTSKPVVI